MIESRGQSVGNVGSNPIRPSNVGRWSNGRTPALRMTHGLNGQRTIDGPLDYPAFLGGLGRIMPRSPPAHVSVWPSKPVTVMAYESSSLSVGVHMRNHGY